MLELLTTCKYTETPDYSQCTHFSLRLSSRRIYGKFDSTQLKALNEFLPNDDEAAGLKAYVANANKNETKKVEMMNGLCPCEKYMVAMMGVPNAADKFNCMLFQIQFRSRITEINESISTLLKACDDVKNSTRLRKLMAVILTIGNQINTGGDGNMAEGFSLDALLKLNEVGCILWSNVCIPIFLFLTNIVCSLSRLKRLTKKPASSST